MLRLCDGSGRVQFYTNKLLNIGNLPWNGLKL